MGKLNVEPAALQAVAARYAELQARLAAIGPQALEEVDRIAASHGRMGFPVALSLLKTITAGSLQLDAKGLQFLAYAERFTGHAAAYTGQDAAGAAGYPTL